VSSAQTCGSLMCFVHGVLARYLSKLHNACCVDSSMLDAVCLLVMDTHFVSIPKPAKPLAEHFSKAYWCPLSNTK
jgi:hypothetical protein